METLEPKPQDAWCLEGTYTEKDIRTFASFLAKRVAGSKIWALGLFILIPLYWSGDFRATWRMRIPIALVLVAFILLMRFMILPRKLYAAAVKLPGIFQPRRITIDEREVANTSEAGGYRFLLDNLREVVSTPDYLFVMVTPKQGMPIPMAWIKAAERGDALLQFLQSRGSGGTRP